MCFSVCGEERGEHGAAQMAPSKQRLPGGDATRKPGEGVHRGDLQLRGGARSLRRRHTDGQFVHRLHQNVTLHKERQNIFQF